MNATELIELYDALPLQEQKIVAAHISKGAVQTVETQPQEGFKELVNAIFDKHSQLMERLA